MAQTATVYTLSIDLSHVDRGVYETLDLRIARHPSESAEYMVTRVLAYCLEYQEGIAFTEGLSSGDEPPVLVRDLTGRITTWIEVGMPSADRLHRASKLADRVVVYTHRDIRQVLAQFDGQRIHRAAEIPIYELDRTVVEACAAALDRRSALTLNVMDGQLYLEMGSQSLSLPLVAHTLP
ncbi:MAG: YaeQ family protein [Acidobacteriota bacterium]